ncbi:MAG: hypothetical protein WC427_02460 [Candidatus Paceibacterota bacterium]
MEQQVLSGFDSDFELEPLIIESSEEQIREKLFTLFCPAKNGSLGRRNEKLARQITELIKKNPDLIWLLTSELEKYQNAEGANIKNAHDRIKNIFQELQKKSYLKGSRFRSLAKAMENWPNHGNLYAFKSTAAAFCPNPHAKAWEGIASLKNQDNPWNYHL